MDEWFVIQDGASSYRVDIVERTFRFAVNSVFLVREIESVSYSGRPSRIPGVVVRQFIRSSTSVGANVEEAQSAESKRDFIHKMKIAQKEIREARYWLRLIRESGISSSAQLVNLLDESDQLLRIISKIIVNTLKRPRTS